jgi:hypothetical protein
VARIRSVKPSIWGDDKFSDLSRDARLLLLGIISNADDKGRFIATPASLAGAIFPHDDLNLRDIKRWRDEVAATGIVLLYEVKGRCYGRLRRWERHQRIDKPQPSTLPPPPETDDSLPDEPPNDSENGSTNESPNGSQNGSENHSMTEEEGDKDRDKDVRERRKSAAPPADTPRPDVDEICDRLVQHLVANNCKPPTVNGKWRDSARLLLDRDNRPLAEVLAVLDWSQRHTFWRGIVLSLPKFREKYDQLRIQRENEITGRASNGHRAPQASRPDEAYRD